MHPLPLPLPHSPPLFSSSPLHSLFIQLSLAPPMPLLLLQAIVTGDFVLARASMALARIGHAEVINVLATVIDDLVKGVWQN